MTFCATKDPDAKLNYTIDWHDWLDTGESITTSTWSITANESPISLTVDSTAIGDYTDVSPIVTNQLATVYLSGGTVGVTYTVTNHIVTTPSSLEDDRSIKFILREK